jgi:hypothetical protein
MQSGLPASSFHKTSTRPKRSFPQLLTTIWLVAGVAAAAMWPVASVAQTGGQTTLRPPRCLSVPGDWQLSDAQKGNPPVTSVFTFKVEDKAAAMRALEAKLEDRQRRVRGRYKALPYGSALLFGCDGLLATASPASSTTGSNAITIMLMDSPPP